MFVLQHIWSRWDKLSRGANSPVRRTKLVDVYALPPVPTGHAAVLHEIADDMWQPALQTRLEALERDAWKRRDSVLGWHMRGREVDITLSNPSPWRLQTKWPRYQPRPLFTLRSGETARIEWNGRLRMSLFGSNRSSYYEQHVYWLALTDAPGERLFLDAEPRKRIDLTTHIY